MAKVIITRALREEILRRFKSISKQIFSLMKVLEREPKKGKVLGHVADIVIKELRFKKYRFYFITDGQMMKFASEDELVGLIIKFVRMSEKKDQQKIINEIKNILRTFGFDNFY